MRFFLIFQLFWLPISSAEQIVTTCLDYEPYELNDSGGKVWLGRNIQVLHRIVEKLNLQLDDSLRASFPRCVQLLKSGQIDILIGLQSDKKLQQHLGFLPLTKRKPIYIYSLEKLSDVNQSSFGFLMHRGFQLPTCALNEYLPRQFVEVESTEVAVQMVGLARATGALASEAEAKFVFNALNIDINKLNKTKLCEDDNAQINLAFSKQSKFYNRYDEVKQVVAKMRITREIDDIIHAPL